MKLRALRAHIADYRPNDGSVVSGTMRNQPIFFIAVVAFAAICSLAEAKKIPAVIPTDAQSAIKEVRSAAQNTDFMKLRSLMQEDFLWSFGVGGDGNADQAIAEWRKDSRYMRELAQVLKSGCQLYDEKTVNCPGKGGMNFRATFSKSEDGWRMRAFVEGD
jgi:hypothetical protein